MSIEKEIKMIETMIEDIETYVNKGVWHPDRQVQIAREITEADKILNQLMVGHSIKADVLSEEQVRIVSNLLKRFSESKDKLPSSPFA
ncbi:hypothetical protein ACFLV4_03710 [Chloroflexota bacterium]